MEKDERKNVFIWQNCEEIQIFGNWNILLPPSYFTFDKFEQYEEWFNRTRYPEQYSKVSKVKINEVTFNNVKFVNERVG